MRFRAAGGLVLVLLVPLFFPSAMAYGERVFNANAVAGTSSYDTDSGQRVAQSFTPSVAFVLYNVTLNVENLPSVSPDVSLSVSIQQDAAGIPSGASLASASATRTEAQGRGWLDFPLAARPTLSAGTTYWIVATNSEAAGGGYRWFHSGADVVPGVARTWTSGGGWSPPQPADLMYVTYGQPSEAEIVVDLVVDRAIVDPGQLLAYTIYLNNTGAQAAPDAWVNLSLPADVAFVSDTAASLGGVRTGNYNWTFADLTNAPHSFAVTAAVDLDAPAGGVLTATAYLDYTTSSGSKGPSSSASASSTVSMKQKTMYLAHDGVADSTDFLRAAPPTGTVLDFDGDGERGLTLPRSGSMADAPTWTLTPAFARPYRILGSVTVRLYMDSRNPGQSNTLNLTLFDGGKTGTLLSTRTYSITFDGTTGAWESLTFDLGNSSHQFSAGSVATLAAFNVAGQDVYVAYNSPTELSRIETFTDTYVAFDSLSVEDANGPTAAFSTRDTVFIRTTVSDPFGSGEIVSANIDLWDPDGTPVATGAPLTLTAIDPGNPSAWKSFVYTYANPPKQGLYAFGLTATEGNGVQASAIGSFVVRIPILSLAISPTASQAQPWDVLAYTIYLNNTGQGAARAWLNATIPPGLSYVSDTAGGIGGSKTGNYNWTFPSLAPDAHTFSLTTRVDPGVPGGSALTLRLDLAYADEKGFLWPGSSRQATVSVRSPNLVADLALDKSVLHPSEVLTITVRFDNVGQASTANAWANVTLSANLVYGSDDSTSLPEFATRDTSGNPLRYAFVNVGVGPHAFTIAATVSATLGPGDPVSVDLSLDYVVVPGRPSERSTDVANAVGAGPVLDISLAGPGTADPGDVVALTLTYDNSGSEAAQDVWLNLTLAGSLAFLSSTPPPDSVSGPRLTWRFGAVSVGPHSLVAQALVAVGLGDGLDLSSSVAAEYADAVGTRFARGPASHTVRVTAPILAFAFSSPVSSVDVGDVVQFTVSYDNGGSGTAGDVWVNLTLSDSLQYVGSDAPVTATVAGPSVLWHLYDIGSGPHSFRATASVSLGARHGDILPVASSFNGTDANHNHVAEDSESLLLTVSTAKVTVDLAISDSQVRRGSVVTYTIRVNNTGGRAASLVWINDSLDTRLEYLSDTSGLPLRRDGSNLSWTLQNLGSSQSISFEVTMRVFGNVDDLVSNGVGIEYTNSRGLRIGTHRSAQVAVEILPEPPPTSGTNPLLYLLVVVALVVLLAGFLAWRSRRYEIEEVFLVYRTGVLLHHLSRSLSRDMDEDVLSGMLNVVQDFVRDSFKYGENRELDTVSFGDYHVLFERGEEVYLAVAFKGADRKELRRRVRRAIEEVETKFELELMAWDGSMDPLLGAKEIVRKLVE